MYIVTQVRERSVGRRSPEGPGLGAPTQSQQGGCKRAQWLGHHGLSGKGICDLALMLTARKKHDPIKLDLCTYNRSLESRFL